MTITVIINSTDELEKHKTTILSNLAAYGGGQRPLVRSRTAAVRSE